MLKRITLGFSILFMFLVIGFVSFEKCQITYRTGRTHAEPSTSENIKVKPVSVNLYSISSYNFGQTYCILDTGDNQFDVAWGESVTGTSFVNKESSYFGFDGIVIVECSEFKGSNGLKIRTEYGEFLYKIKRSFLAYKVDGVFVDKSGKPLFDFSKRSSDCFVFSQTTGMMYEFDFVTGTKIVVD